MDPDLTDYEPGIRPAPGHEWGYELRIWIFSVIEARISLGHLSFIYLYPPFSLLWAYNNRP